LKKHEDILESQKMIEAEYKRQTERENEYKNKLNNMNEKIYNHALKLNGYYQNSNPNSPSFKEPFYVKNDHEFNRKLAEIRANERENQKRDQTMVNQRLKDLEVQRDFDNKQKIERAEHQRHYKEFLDYQKVSKDSEKPVDDKAPNPLIMPSYHYPNKPIPTSKRAVDPLSWMMRSGENVLLDSGRHCYLGDTQLRHNPIVQPLDNIDYNKYLNKQRKYYSHNHYGNSDLKIDQSTRLSKVGNSIIA
jgi:hypothetical protein